jgi:hypothetical protein
VSIPAENTISKLTPTMPSQATPEPPVNLEVPKLPRAAKAPELPAAAVVTAPPKVQKKTHSVRQIHAPSVDNPPKLTGLDKNGIGIPSN